MHLLIRQLQQHRRVLVLAILASFVNQFCLLLDPVILQYLTDRYATNPHKLTWADFTGGTAVALSGLMAAVCLAWIAKGFQTSYVNRISHVVSNEIFSEAIRNCMRMPFSSFADRSTGQTVEGLRRLRISLDGMMKMLVNQALTTVIAVSFIVFYALRVHLAVAVYFLVLAPIIAAASIILSSRIRRLDEELLRRHAILSGSATETLRNIELVKSLGIAEQEINRLHRSSSEVLNLELEKARRMRVYTFFHGAAVHLLRGGLLGMLLYLRISGQITSGQILAFYLCSMYVFLPLQELGSVAIYFRETQALLTQFHDLLEPAPEPPPSGKVVGRIRRLEFDRVSFTYPEKEEPALSEISFVVNPGQVIAFVGPSGSGKTTLVKLISALYPPGDGAIRFNGVRSVDADVEALRQSMGLVTQDTQLFSGSIRENLAILKPDASDQELLEAIDAAAATPVLERASQGLDSIIGESGLRISGGERQRLSIARSLLRKPDLLIFDEATSALDPVTEREIATTLMETTRHRRFMTVVIAHRLSTVAHADRIYVLNAGRIVESGTHTELLAQSGLYANLWQTQTHSLTVSAES